MITKHFGNQDHYIIIKKVYTKYTVIKLNETQNSYEKYKKVMLKLPRPKPANNNLFYKLSPLKDF